MAASRRPAPAPAPPLAVVDVGSNSARMIVVAATTEGHLEILADARSSLRLVRDIDSGGRLSAAAGNRVVAALLGFLAVSHSAGATDLTAVATAAVREASNREDFVAQVAEQTGIDMEVVDGDQEARYAFAGAVHGLPVDSGMLLDIGGGSLEICHFRNRRALRQWTLPLGALRLTDRFLAGDPPKASEVARLRDHVTATLGDAGVPELRPGERLVGTGGTLRNLAKVHRAGRTYPIARLHGYVLRRSDIDSATDLLASRAQGRRQRLPGLSDDRADSIVGGSLCAQTLMSSLAADQLVVSGRGLREGIALERLGLRMGSAADVRAASVSALASRFSTFDPDRAELRWSIAALLLEGLEATADPEMQEALDHASVLVDIGRSIDYYSRWEHAASMVAAADLYGFAHRDIVLLSGLLEKAGADRVSLPGYRSLLAASDRRQLDRLAVILALAEELGRRVPDHLPLRVQRRRTSIALVVPSDIGQLDTELERRFQRSFGKRLRVEFDDK